MFLLSLKDLIEEYTGRGKSTFTKTDALEDSGLSESAFHKATSRLQKQSRIFQPRQGFFVIVRPEYRSRGAPPPSYYIDHLMQYLEEPYYVGVLSAAKLHGASHHAPQEFQVVVNTQMRNIEKSGTRIRFLKNKDLDVVPLEKKKVPTGYFQVSTPEATLVDVVYYRKYAAGLDNVANIVIELGKSDQLEPSKLFEAAVGMHDTATVQRLGYLLDRFGFKTLSDPLEKWIKKQSPTRIPLLPGTDRYSGEHDKRWHVLVNYEIEPDVVVG